MENDIITLADGSGGIQTDKLIKSIFSKYFSNEYLDENDDSTLVPGSKKISVTTDSFVVDPFIFNGGDIGRLSICGTVNDLLMRGAVPKYLTAGFILETGLEKSKLERIVKSMAETAKEANIEIIAGDTKVINGNGGLLINTSGIGFIEHDLNISAKSAKIGDDVILSGNLGDHHAAILSHRLGIKNNIQSDNAPLNSIILPLIENEIEIHTMRDVTRGGLATILNELAASCGNNIIVNEGDLPVSEDTANFAKILGLSPLYMGNEGKAVIIIPKSQSQKALEIIKQSKYGKNATIIGKIAEGNGRFVLNTKIGGSRFPSPLVGEGLPRIC